MLCRFIIAALEIGLRGSACRCPAHLNTRSMLIKISEMAGAYWHINHDLENKLQRPMDIRILYVANILEK